MAIIYREKWNKHPYKAFMTYLRDFIINFLPFKKLPVCLIKILYGVKPRFVFLVHPRRSEDIYIATPFFTLLRKFLSKKKTLNLISKLPPFVLATIKTNKGIDGAVISSFFLPDQLSKDRRKTLKEAIWSLRFANKISCRNSAMGLGGWWPIVTRRGLALKKFAKEEKIVVTNGHAGTLLALYMALDKIARLIKVDIKDMRIAIIGAGKMGTNLIRMLYDIISDMHIGLIDINEQKLLRLKDEFKNKNLTILPRKHNTNLKSFLSDYFLAICVTSNARVIIKPEDIPDYYVIIDDSRPEAIPRNTDENRLILEGGLLKINGLNTNYDFGFGIDDNAFGCLVEAYLLSMNLKELDPTLGDVDLKNFRKILSLAESGKISIGPFKSGNLILKDNTIAEIVDKRRKAILNLKL